MPQSSLFPAQGLPAETSHHELSSKSQEEGPKTLREIQGNVH